ncbi:MAG: hypothetical protein ACTSYF_11660, partial [Promethearchaeota archaeon]
MKEVQLNTLDQINKCKICSGNIILTRTGYTCSNCGMVFGDNYMFNGFLLNDDGKYDIKSSKQFVAIGKQIDNVMNLGSYIDYYHSYFFYDSNNKPLAPSKQELYRRLKF